MGLKTLKKQEPLWKCCQTVWPGIAIIKTQIQQLGKLKIQLPCSPCCTDWFWNWAYGLFGIPEKCCPFGDWLCGDDEPCFCNREGGTSVFRGLTRGERIFGASLEQEKRKSLSYYNMRKSNTWKSLGSISIAILIYRTLFTICANINDIFKKINNKMFLSGVCQ